MRAAATLLPLVAGTLAAPALAQDAVSTGIAITTDERRRGIGWSGGEAAATAEVFARRDAFGASARILSTRGSARHGGAAAAAELTIDPGWDAGAIRLTAHAHAHLFVGGRDRMDYVEIGGTAGYDIGPFHLAAGASYAPAQRAIGGSNFYVHADASAGVPRTPLTVIATIGHSSGTTDDPARAQRLRPGGAYTDWRLGVEHRRNRWTIGLDYTGTDVSRDRAFGPFADSQQTGARVLARLRLDV